MPHLNLKLHPNEKIYVVVRRHIIIPVVKTVFWIILLVLIILFEDWLVDLLPINNSSEMINSVAVLIRGSFYMFATLGLLMVWTMYYLNLQVVTNERIIDINQRGMLHHETTEFNIQVVQDATTEIKGVFSNILNFGNVRVQTAGEQQNFVFDHVPNPKHIAHTIITLHDQAQNRH